MTTQSKHNNFTPDLKFIEHMRNVARDVESWPKNKLAIVENSISGTAHFVEIRDRSVNKSVLRIEKKS